MSTHTPDSNKVRRLMALGALTAPTTLLPFLAGVTALAATWTFGLPADIGVLAGMAGILGAGGMFVTNLLFKGEQYARQALLETREESAAQQAHALDELDTRLCQDDDPRTEAALRDLRALCAAFESLKQDGALNVNAVALAELATGMQELYNQCVGSLEQSLRLWETSRKLVTKAAKDPLVQQRERILEDIGHSIRRMGETIAAVQNLAAGENGKSELRRISESLDQHLTVARQVEQRVRDFEQQLDVTGRDRR